MTVLTRRAATVAAESKKKEAKQKRERRFGQRRSPLSSHTMRTRSLAKTFRFMDLPGELRNRIYKFALPEHTVVCPDSTDEEPLNLAMVSRTVRQESLSLYWSSRRFHFLTWNSKGEGDDIYRWLKYKVTQKFISQLECVAIAVDGGDPGELEVLCRTVFQIYSDEETAGIGLSTFRCTNHSHGCFSATNPFIYPFLVTAAESGRKSGKVGISKAVVDEIMDLSLKKTTAERLMPEDYEKGYLEGLWGW